MNDILEALQAEIPGLEIEEAHGQVAVRAAKEQIIDVLTYLKSRGFRYFSDLGCADHLQRKPRFDVVYHVYHLEGHWRLRIKVGVDEDDRIPSATQVFRGADWAEREIFDLFGLYFEGHPNMTRILLPEGWKGYPLRRDYPLVGTDPLPPLARD